MVGSTRDAEHEIARVEELSVRHEAATTHPDAALDWLNRPTHAHLEQRLQARLLPPLTPQPTQATRNDTTRRCDVARCSQDIGRRLERHFLSVQLPELEFPVRLASAPPPTPQSQKPPIRPLSQPLLVHPRLRCCFTRRWLRHSL